MQDVVEKRQLSMERTERRPHSSIVTCTSLQMHPQTWWIFLGDIFMICTEGLDHLKIFVDYLNNIHPTIKLTSNHSLTGVPFLDVMVSLHNGTIYRN